MAPGTAESLERVAGGFGAAGGPVWHPEGYLRFSDSATGTMYAWHPEGRLVSLQRTGGATASTGISGMALDNQGRLILCDPRNACVSRTERDGSRTVLADYFEGQRLNGPQDVVCRADGSVYFTDALREDGEDTLPFNGVYRIVEGRRLQLLAADLSEPSGVAFSSDQRLLYVANCDRKRMFWMRYKVDGDGILAEGSVFFDASASQEAGVPQGLKVDRAGNILATGPGGLWIFSPIGDHLGTIRVPEVPSNLQWGGKGTDLFITAQTSLYRMRWTVGGNVPQ